MRCATLFLIAIAAAAEPKIKLNGIQVSPGDFTLTGKWAAQRIVVTGRLADGGVRDMTGAARFKSSNRKIAVVSNGGLVTPVSDGDAFIDVSAGGKRQKLHVTVRDSRAVTATFRNDVRPLLGKLGCNATGCHGAVRGKGGLKLSLF